MSVRQGFPEPDPSGIADKTPPLSVTKPLGRAFLANGPGVIPAEILTDREEVQPEGGAGESSGEPTDISMEEMDRAIDRGQKRDREEEEGEADDEEYSARVVKRLLGVVSQSGPPWYDANGMPLGNEKGQGRHGQGARELAEFPHVHRGGRHGAGEARQEGHQLRVGLVRPRRPSRRGWSPRR